MKKFFKIFGISLVVLLLLLLGGGVYFYKTNPMLQAIVNNDESKLYYFPSKEMNNMDDLPYKQIVLEVDDSIQIHAYLFEPEQEKQANVFLIHGAGGNVGIYEPMFKTLVNNGFAVYAFDWRGYGESSGTPGYKGVMKDTEVAFEDFIAKTASDSVKNIVYGMSLGGQMAVKITVENESKVDLLVLDATVESAQSLAIDYAPAEFLKEKAKKHPEDFNQDYVAVRDIALIKNTAKLIIHSKKDQDVPFSRGKNVYEAAQEPKEFWETETAHIMTLKDLPEEAVEKINKNLN
ncbi:lysophospholipase [Fulvivirga maritima]|uniref:alpha/beta hydrolase n=1 Tax=Fulvivirga maritima TaxID=2904247 RepID=UPI001F34E48A|nr:alpha/beta fold hydrolase [Fulvivirga maritima]UII25630.1 lysophospholipase [Fulvivirga maritima]